MTWTDFIVRGTVVLVAGFAASFVFARASAALRHFMWTAAFVALLAMPVAMQVAPKIAIGAWPAAGAPAGVEGAAGVGTLRTQVGTPVAALMGSGVGLMGGLGVGRMGGWGACRIG